jgi:ParB-like chromosome segregation protein Spo0J
MDTNTLDPNLPTVPVPIDELTPHPQNPRQGDIGAIVESIRVNGFFNVIGVQRSTGYIVFGNHRWLAAKEVRKLILTDPDWEGWPQLWGTDLATIPVVYLDVDDEAALRMLLADNRLSDLATYDDHSLATLLTDLHQQTADALAGTGYSPDDLDELLRRTQTVPLDTGGSGGGTGEGWIVLRFIVPPALHAAFMEAMEATGKEDEVTQLREMVRRVESFTS